MPKTLLWAPVASVGQVEEVDRHGAVGKRRVVNLAGGGDGYLGAVEVDARLVAGGVVDVADDHLDQRRRRSRVRREGGRRRCLPASWMKQFSMGPTVITLLPGSGMPSKSSSTEGM